MPRFPFVNHPALDFARYYKSLGWPVFPLSPRKKSPATQHGFHDATLEDSQIEQWWGGERAAQRFGIGVPTGQTSGFIVVDIDARNGGWGSVERLKAEGKFLPDTTIQVNTSGERMSTGRHYYFQYPAGDEVLPGINGAWPGIDIKSDGGYVAVPPSTHPTGIIYDHVKACQEIELEPLPDWVLEKMRQNRSSEGKRVLSDIGRSEPGLGSQVREGGRNTHLTRVAGWLRRENHPPESILATLWEVNKTVCNPPVSEKEVRRVVWSVCQYAPNPDLAVPAIEDAPVALQFLSGRDLSTLEMPEPDWILENRLAQGDICLMAGAPESGKSWFALEFALAAATMRPILGLETVFGRLRTLILDEENTLDEFQRRFWKLKRAHGVDGEEYADLLERNIQVLNQAGESFSNKQFLAAIIEKVREFQPHMIVIDSATAMSGVKNENDAVEVRAFTNSVLKPLRAICNSTILLIHHTSKLAYQDPAERTVRLAALARGSIDWQAGADSSMLLLREGGDDNPFIRFYQTKQRRGFAPGPLKIRLVDGVEGGTRPIVLDPPTAPVNTRLRRGKSSKRAQGVVAILEWLTSQEATQFDAIPKMNIIEETLLYLVGTTSALNKKDLHNAMDTMVSKGIFIEVSDKVDSPSQTVSDPSHKGFLMRLTISQEQIASHIKAMR
jgi:hypothetical protein